MNSTSLFFGRLCVYKLHYSFTTFFITSNKSDLSSKIYSPLLRPERLMLFKEMKFPSLDQTMLPMASERVALIVPEVFSPSIITDNSSEKGLGNTVISGEWKMELLKDISHESGSKVIPDTLKLRSME